MLTARILPLLNSRRVVEEEVDLLEFLFLDVQHGVGKLAQLAGVIPVSVAGDDPGHVVGIEADGRHLLADGRPAARGVPVEDVAELLPAAVVQRDLAVGRLDDADVHRQVHRGRVAHVGHEGAVGTFMKRLLSTIHAECLGPCSARRTSRSSDLGALEALPQGLRRSLWSPRSRSLSSSSSARMQFRHRPETRGATTPASIARAASLAFHGTSFVCVFVFPPNGIP